MMYASPKQNSICFGDAHIRKSHLNFVMNIGEKDQRPENDLFVVLFEIQATDKRILMLS